MTTAHWAVLAACVYFAGVVDSLAGGGGLITLPAYMAAGLPAPLLLGTNKLGSAIGTVGSCVNYQRRHKLDLRGLLPAFALAMAGSVLGARLGARLNAHDLRVLLLVLLPALTVFILARPGFGSEDVSHRHESSALVKRAALIAAPVGAYDGFFGPPTGTFFALLLVRVCGYDIVTATARAKFLNLSTNVAALATFLWLGRVDYKVGLAMGAASLCGHWTGSTFGSTRGSRVIRPAMIFVCSALFIKLLFL